MSIHHKFHACMQCKEITRRERTVRNGTASEHRRQLTQQCGKNTSGVASSASKQDSRGVELVK